MFYLEISYVYVIINNNGCSLENANCFQVSLTWVGLDVHTASLCARNVELWEFGMPF